MVINFCKNLPAIIVLPHLDDIWKFVDNLEQNYIVSLLDNIHASIPILIIATHDESLPAAVSILSLSFLVILKSMKTFENKNNDNKIKLEILSLCSHSTKNYFFTISFESFCF